MFDLEKALAELSRLNSYLVDIRREVNLYEQLYCVPSSLSVLNGNLTSVFSIVQRSMFISILTRVSAVFDAKSFGSDPNLSLAFVEDKYHGLLSTKTSGQFQDLNDEFKRLNIKKFRNKLIAHNDLSAVFGASPVSHSIKDGDIDRLLVGAREFCISLCHDLPGGIQAVLQVIPWRLRSGDDGLELVRRVALGACVEH
ncbi:AbiU2 domain-containing protein [Pseudomonas protegens]|uniref:AbiU2 domain-containing protein n=1 Tax=Pseudomonas protegens TaxID=380021 RepID=UPI0022827FA4|nr:hypothetical protein [Pseudomonas protegens]MCY7264343.1 hypothetical protein [Pseudomonas protegens]MDP9514699.1 hypothetical protein [Pseudomonas protegens]